MTPLESFLLRAYLDGELDAAANEAFELLLIERPDLAEWVEADMALHLGLAEPVSAAGQPDPPTAIAATANVVDIATARRPRLLFSPALAAGLALVLGVGAGFLARRPPPAGLEMATLLYIDKTRDIASQPTLVLPPNGAIVLLAPVASQDDCLPQVRLLQPGRADLSAFAKPDEFGYVSLVVPRAALRPGAARVEVQCGSAAAAHYDVRFEETSAGS
jgi:hypothetical protein